MPAQPTPPDENAIVNPYLSAEDQNMEMTPVVMGPPAYGSPDPTTSARRLAPLDQAEIGETLSEDYAADALEAGAEAGSTAGQDAVEEAAEAEKDMEDYNNWTVAQLDEEFGDDEGYPSSGNKADKVAFAEAQREA